MLYDILRSFMFRLDPETAHKLGLVSMQQMAHLGPLNPLHQSLPPKPVSVMGLQFPNRVGMAAGMDKDGECIEGLAAIGFGFIEVGTVTPRPQPGNAKPRLFRLVQDQALINRMGFNNKGVESLCGRLAVRRFEGVLGVNIGKNLTTAVDDALDDYRAALSAAYPHADYVAVNISSPNTPGLRSLQTGEHFTHLLRGLDEARQALADRHGKRVPLAIKIAPDLTAEEIARLADLLVEFGMDAVIATNTTLSRAGVEQSPHAAEAGGLSGRPLLERSTEVVLQLASRLQGTLPIIACGGIFAAADAQAKLAAGASLVQIYTGFIYRGPALVREIVEACG